MNKDFDLEKVTTTIAEISNELHLLFKDENDFNYTYLILLFILQMKMYQDLTKEESFDMFCKVFELIEGNEGLKELFKGEENV